MLFYPFFVMAPKNFISNQNPDKKHILRDEIRIKKLICHVNEKNSPKIKLSNFRIKKFPNPVSRSLSQPFPDKKSTPPPVALSHVLCIGYILYDIYHGVGV